MFLEILIIMSVFYSASSTMFVKESVLFAQAWKKFPPKTTNKSLLYFTNKLFRIKREML